MRTLILIAALLFPMAAFAAGSSSDTTPPKPTQTTKSCKDGQVWDKRTKTCVDAKESRLDDDTRYGAVRELAYAGKYEDALYVLAAMSDQSESRVLTYYGFINRKAGRTELGMQYYQAALKADPDNLLARSYMGQGLVASGNIEAARVQLAEIRARGGKSSWPELSLRKALQTGKTYNY
ncbi:tetratricopeptide repeat protein [Hoeflea sp.]|uniref:tetratricopeptide repeat protein n=1 Tax=Hoeflea sp. TaxID=1940281 RepID=UPI003A92BE15